jgi:hypothetical protein
VRAAYFYRGILAITTTERVWDGWAVKLAPSDATIVEELKRCLGPDVWRGDREARIRFFGRLFLVHAMLLVLILVGGRLASHLDHALR